MKEEDGRRRGVNDWLVWVAVRINVGVLRAKGAGGVASEGGGCELDVTEPDAVGRRRGLSAVWRMMACVAQ